jgi:hypothetical protein
MSLFAVHFHNLDPVKVQEVLITKKEKLHILPKS